MKTEGKLIILDDEGVKVENKQIILDTEEYYRLRREERIERSRLLGMEYSSMGLIPGLPELQVLSKTIADGTNMILFTGIGGCAGKRQISIHNRNEFEDEGYHSDIYDSFANLLIRAEANILAGLWKENDLARCHRCIEKVYVGETSLETWLILGGILYCYNDNGIITIEARKHGITTEDEKLFWTATALTLGEALRRMNIIMSQYNIPNLAGILEFDNNPSPEDIEKTLRLSGI